MPRIYKSLCEYQQSNDLPKKLDVEIDGYGTYNISITYGLTCIHNNQYIDSTTTIPFRKLINHDIGVIKNLSNALELTIEDMALQLPNRGELVGKNIAIMMGVDGWAGSVGILHKYKNKEQLRNEFIYIFKSIIGKYRSGYRNKNVPYI